MPDIQVLQPHVANLIAAGEVVERPASVAKELMENAIDAGAKAVTVEISHGGMTFLRVTDDGRGIPAGQLQTAFLRHATSKLRTEYDLEAIGTLGFRGEALAAIAAVSRIDVMSRTGGSALGASLSLEGGVAGPVEEAGCPLGTTMVVRDLFYNTPARLKFMKKDSAEGAAVFAVVQRVALSHPEVRVKFIRDGKQELLTPGDGQLQAAVYAVLGRELALGFVPVQGSGEGMSVTGFVSLPACCRSSRNWQFFFVNGRQVKSRLMLAALEEAYQNQKMVGKFPGCVLHLEMKLSTVDVNVHPAKTEVKFGNDRAVFQAVYHAVLSALERDRSHPAASLERPKAHDTVTPNQTALGRMPADQYRAAMAVRDSAGRGAQAAALELLNRRCAPSPAPARPARPKAAQLDVPRGETAAPTPPLSTAPPAAEEKAAVQAAPTPAQGVENSVEKVESVHPQGTKPVEISQKSPEPPPDMPVAPPEPWRMAGELFHTYILVEQGETVLLIDKHAAHERINFDRMKQEGYQPMAQTLLSPAVCRLPAEELEALLEHLPLLEEFGFEAEEFGGGALVVRQAPFDVEVGDIENTLSEIAGKLLATGRADPAAARDELMHTMACKAAIKGGWRTSPQELERLAQAVLSGQVKYCPHGRPVAIELTRRDLEKQFKRA